MNDIYVGSLFSEAYLEHHGILGMKWGVRRFQREDGSLTSAGRKRKLVNEHKNEAEKIRNSDGSLTTAGKSKYRVTGTSNRILRAVGNTLIGQKTAVRMNKGYKEDRKALKKEYNEKKASIGLSEKGRKEKIQSLKTEYKKKKLDAATNAADAIYGKQSHELNRLNQSTSVGKTILKEALLGGYGALKYNEMRVNHNSSRGKAAVVGILASNANLLTGTTLGMVNSVTRSQTKVSRSDEQEVKQYRKEHKKK